MKKAYLPVLMASLFASTQLTAQVKQFDLKSYQTTDYERSSLDLKFNLDQNLYNSSSENTINESFNSLKRRNINGVMNLNFQHVDLKRERIIQYGAGINIYGSSRYSETKNDSVFSSLLDSRQRTSASGSYSIQKFYGNSLNQSWILAGQVNTSGEWFNNTRSEESTIVSSEFLAYPVDASLTIGHAHGRLEEVGVAVKAIYILNDLSESGLLTRAATEQDIALLADKITQLEKERYFDNRLYRKRVMEELVAFFEEHSLVDEQSVSFYNIIADYHFFAGINQRFSGRQLSYSVQPGYRMERSINNGEQNPTSHIETLGFKIEYTDIKPISLKWQRIFNASVYNQNSWRQYRHNDQLHKFEKIPDYINADISYSIGYMPSTRSHIRAYVSSGWYQIMTSNSEEKRYSSGLNNSFGLSSYYYFSERIRLNGELSVNVSDHNQQLGSNADGGTNKRNSVSETFKLSLNYYLF